MASSCRWRLVRVSRRAGVGFTRSLVMCRLLSGMGSTTSFFTMSLAGWVALGALNPLSKTLVG